MGQQIGNGADLSAGPVWELGRRKKKKKKGRDYKDVIFPHLPRRHTNTQWVTHTRSLNLTLPLSPIILVWSASSLLRLLKLKSQRLETQHFDHLRGARCGALDGRNTELFLVWWGLLPMVEAELHLACMWLEACRIEEQMDRWVCWFMRVCFVVAPYRNWWEWFKTVS